MSLPPTRLWFYQRSNLHRLLPLSSSSIIVKEMAQLNTTPSTTTETSAPLSEDTIVQYIVLRADLKNWNIGAIISQGCHASIAAIWENRDDAHTIAYCSPNQINTMHKVVLAASSAEDLLNLTASLSSLNIAHKLWYEQPENVPTCVASKPYPRSFVSPHFKHFRLLREMKK